MKRIIVKASEEAKKRNCRVTASLDYFSRDDEFEDYFDEAMSYIFKVAAKHGLRAELVDVGENNYGYPIGEVNFYRGNKYIDTMNICPWDPNTDDVYYNFNEDLESKAYITEEIAGIATH